MEIHPFKVGKLTGSMAIFVEFPRPKTGDLPVVFPQAAVPVNSSAWRQMIGSEARAPWKAGWPGVGGSRGPKKPGFWKQVYRLCNVIYTYIYI